MAKKKLNQIKSSFLSRGISVAKLGLNAGVKYAANRIGNKSFDDFVTSQAGIFTKEFGELKGSLMKAGQMLSVYGEYFFPPQANAILKTLQSDSPAIEWDVMKTYLQKYLSPEQIDELEIDPEPIGTASMGQVHKARIRETGEWIALKIQYPDVDKAIDSDIAALKTLLKVSKIIPDGLDLKAIFEEVKTMLRQELDYVNEARLTRKYAGFVKGDDRFVVPKVYTKFSNKRVLATEYLEGLRADHPLVQSLSSSRRNRLSENFLDLYFKEIFEWNLVQTDPHLGNYKIQIDSLGNDRLVLLDFGACREFSDEFIDQYRKMIQGSVTNDEHMFFKAGEKLGFIRKGDTEEYIQAYKDFCYETVEPFWTPDDPRNTQNKIAADGTYRWKESDLPGRIVKKALQFKKFDLKSPPKEIIFLDRKTGGVFIFLSVLKAEINARKIIDAYLPKPGKTTKKG